MKIDKDGKISSDDVEPNTVALKEATSDAGVILAVLVLGFFGIAMFLTIYYMPTLAVILFFAASIYYKCK